MSLFLNVSELEPLHSRSNSKKDMMKYKINRCVGKSIVAFNFYEADTMKFVLSCCICKTFPQLYLLTKLSTAHLCNFDDLPISPDSENFIGTISQASHKRIEFVVRDMFNQEQGIIRMIDGMLPVNLKVLVPAIPLYVSNPLSPPVLNRKFVDIHVDQSFNKSLKSLFHSLSFNMMSNGVEQHYPDIGYNQIDIEDESVLDYVVLSTRNRKWAFDFTPLLSFGERVKTATSKNFILEVDQQQHHCFAHAEEVFQESHAFYFCRD